MTTKLLEELWHAADRQYHLNPINGWVNVCYKQKRNFVINFSFFTMKPTLRLSWFNAYSAKIPCLGLAESACCEDKIRE